MRHYLLTLCIFLHYLWKLQIRIFCRCGRKRKQIAFIAYNFVIHLHIFIVSMLKIASPLSSEIRSQIRHKKTLWRNYVRDKNSTTWLQYTKQRNKVKIIVRNDLKEEQNLIAQQYKSNPKKFWKILEVCQFKN